MPAKPDPKAQAEKVKPEVDALVAEGRFLEAIAKVNASVDEAAADIRRPLLESIQAAAAKDEIRRGELIDGLILDGKLTEAQQAISIGRRELPTTFDGARFTDQERRLKHALRKANDPNWASAFGHLCNPTILQSYGRSGWELIRAQVGRYFRVRAERDDALRLIASAGPPPALLAAAIALERPVPARPEKQRVIVRRTLKLPKKLVLGRDDVEGETEMPYFVAIPRMDEKSERLPVLIELHAPQTPEGHVRDIVRHIFEVMDNPAIGPFAFVAPVGWDGYGWWGGALDAIELLVDEIARTLPIDRKRIYLSGMDEGGGGNWRLALERPTRWAAIGPTASPFNAHWKPLIPNLRHTPIFAVHRAGDPVFRAADVRETTSAVKALGNGRVRYVELPGKEHAVVTPQVVEEKIRWIFSQRRAERPLRLTCRVAQPGPRRFHWVRTLAYDGRKTTSSERRCDVGVGRETRFTTPCALDVTRREGNRVEVVHSDGVTRFELLLSPRMFDMTRPILVTQGRHVILQQRIRPNPRLQLELAQRYPDAQYVASVEVTPRKTHWTDRYATRLSGDLLDKEVAGYGREKFEQLLADLGQVLHGKQLDAAALKRIVDSGPGGRVLEAALIVARQPIVMPAGKHEVQLTLPSHKMKYYMRVPASRRAQRLPLYVELHGGGGVGPHVVQMLEMFHHIGKDVGSPIVGVMPMSETRLGWGPSEDGLRQVHAVIRDVCKRVPIDTSRIYLGGFSMGGFGAWMAAMEDPSLLAAITPNAGRFMPFMKPLLPNLDHLGIYVVHQDGDPIVPVKGAREAVAGLREAKHPAMRYNEIKGNNHAGEGPRAGQRKMRWVFERRRKALPKRIVARCHAPRPLRRYHLVVTGYDAKWPTAEVRLPGASGDLKERWFRKQVGVMLEYVGENTFEVSDVAGVTQIEILLSPRMLALDKPVRVRLGDKVLFAGKVDASLASRLRLARRFFDVGYHASLIVDLTK